ncbi:MAG: hypothetical protein H0U76_09690 [Ktedonobacteraceae bacterium]|nr:hypothetical protein [Ktedonobacteraceae bacterium]
MKKSPIPTISDGDEREYLNTLEDSDLVGFSNSANNGYYARVLRQKYVGCHVRLTATTFRILQPGISAEEIRFTSVQQARQRLLDAFDTPSSAPTMTKEKWLQTLKDHQLPLNA